MSCSVPGTVTRVLWDQCPVSSSGVELLPSSSDATLEHQPAGSRGGAAGVGIGPSNFARHSRPSRQNKTQLHCVVRVTSWAVLPLRASRHNDSAGDTAESAHQGLTPFVFRGWEEQEVDRRVLASTSTHGPVDGLPLCVCVCVCCDPSQYSKGLISP